MNIGIRITIYPRFPNFAVGNFRFWCKGFHSIWAAEFFVIIPIFGNARFELAMVWDRNAKAERMLL